MRVNTRYRNFTGFCFVFPTKKSQDVIHQLAVSYKLRPVRREGHTWTKTQSSNNKHQNRHDSLLITRVTFYGEDRKEIKLNEPGRQKLEFLAVGEVYKVIF